MLRFWLTTITLGSAALTVYLYIQVIQGIQNGPYKNIYNPENFFVGSQGSGAANNWAAGYAAGDTVQEEVFDMIDREADGSDSLEVRYLEKACCQAYVVDKSH